MRCKLAGGKLLYGGKPPGAKRTTYQKRNGIKKVRSKIAVAKANGSKNAGANSMSIFLIDNLF